MRRIYSRSLPEPQEPTTQGRTLTLDRYHELARTDGATWAAFNAWLEAENLSHRFIYEATFGEAQLDAQCYDLDDQHKPYLVSDTEVARCRRTFNTSTPPPSSLLPYLV